MIAVERSQKVDRDIENYALDVLSVCVGALIESYLDTHPDDLDADERRATGDALRLVLIERLVGDLAGTHEFVVIKR